MHVADILSMPDKLLFYCCCLALCSSVFDRWEYPFFAAWDTAFHCIPLAVVDPAFAKKQLDLLTREWYMKPDGQIPAYEWNFSDVNPPVHAWYIGLGIFRNLPLIGVSIGRPFGCSRSSAN